MFAEITLPKLSFKLPEPPKNSKFYLRAVFYGAVNAAIINSTYKLVSTITQTEEPSMFYFGASMIIARSLLRHMLLLYDELLEKNRIIDRDVICKALAIQLITAVTLIIPVA